MKIAGRPNRSGGFAPARRSTCCSARPR